MPKAELVKPPEFFESDIPSEKIDLLRKLKNSRVKNLVRYCWEPPDEAAKLIDERLQVSASSLFRRGLGCLLITLESGLIVGFFEQPSLGSVIVWIEQTEDGQKIVEGSVLDDDDNYPIDALDETYSEEFIYNLVGQEIVSVSILKRVDPNWGRTSAGEVGVILKFKDNSELLISRNLCKNINDFDLILRDEIDPEILDQLEEIPVEDIKVPKEKDLRGIGIRHLIPIVCDTWSKFEEKDLYTTAEITEAVRSATSDAGALVAAPISYPVPIILNEEPHLRFFIYVSNRIDGVYHLMAPFYKVESPINTYKEVKLTKAEPQDFNLNVQPRGSLGVSKIVNRVRSFRGELPYGYDKVSSWTTQLYSTVDEILQIYPRSSETLTEGEKDIVSTYFELFVSLIQPPFLPAYRSLNPHFFDWLESVLGYEVDPLLGPQNTVIEHHVVDGVPVRLVQTTAAELKFYAMNMQTGKFTLDMSYLSLFIIPSHDSRERVQRFTEEQFNQYVNELRDKIRETAQVS